MTDKKNFVSISDFFNNDKFIAWRLFHNDELNEYWENFIKENPSSKAILHHACQRFDAVKLNEVKLTSEEEKMLYGKILQRIRIHKRNKRKRLVYWLPAAACAAIFIGAIAFFTWNQRASVSSKQHEIVGNSLPSENVQLILGDKVIDLKSNAEIRISEDGNASVTDSVQHDKAVRLADNSINKLLVPYGKRSFITLADGTKVWLNSGTELEFSTNYDGDTRSIRVKGEIYLEVAKSSQPFFVRTENAVIRVLGTSFNISAYEEDDVESVVLVEGSVQVDAKNHSSIALAPGEMATVSADNIAKERVNVSEYISWRDGIIEFNKTSMSDVLKKIGRYYNVSFENASESMLNEQTVSGKLFLSNNLDSVMTSVSILSSTNYVREDNRIIIRKK